MFPLNAQKLISGGGGGGGESIRYPRLAPPSDIKIHSNVPTAGYNKFHISVYHWGWGGDRNVGLLRIKLQYFLGVKA